MNSCQSCSKQFPVDQINQSNHCTKCVAKSWITHYKDLKEYVQANKKLPGK